MISTSNPTRWTLVAVAALVLLVPAALAQPDADRKGERIDRLAETLDLSDAQRAILADAEPEPGALWSVAATLAPTLSEEQKAALYARPERGDRGARRGGKGHHGRRGDRGQRPEGHAERRDGSHAAMQQALGLSAEQIEQLDAVRAAHEAQRQARQQERAEHRRNRAPGEVPTELQAILTPEQQEVFKVHRALAMRMAAGRHGHARGR